MNENFSGAAAQSGIHPSANAGELEPKKLSDALEAASGESQMRMSQVGVNPTGLNQIDDRELEIGDSEDGHEKSNKQPTPSSLLLSTLLSLTAVLVLLTVLRFLLPSTLEFSRYSWHRGQLRAEYDVAGEQLKTVSNDNLALLSQTVARRVCPSVVHVTLDRMDSENESPEGSDTGAPNFFPFRRSMVGQGSGVLVDARGYILTNYHVINDEGSRLSTKGRIQVALPDERVCKAELIGFDSVRDLAVLKIEADGLLPIVWGDSEQMEVGAPVWAVGSPFGLSGSITFGILSGKHRLDLTGTSYDEQRIPRKDRHISARYTDLMQSDVAVNPGNSGGPLVNSRGELVGINTAIIGEAYRGVSFSIPSSIAKVVFEQILESGRMSRGWLGVELVRVTEWKREQAEQLALAIGSEPDEIEFDLAKEKAKEPVRGAVVRRIVSEDSPAAVAGLKLGDHIIQFNEKPVKGVEDLIFEISKSPVGSKIKLLIHRDGETQSMEVVIGERPAN